MEKALEWLKRDEKNMVAMLEKKNDPYLKLDIDLIRSKIAVFSAKCKENLRGCDVND